MQKHSEQIKSIAEYEVDKLYLELSYTIKNELMIYEVEKAKLFGNLFSDISKIFATFDKINVALFESYYETILQIEDENLKDSLLGEWDKKMNSVFDARDKLFKDSILERKN